MLVPKYWTNVSTVSFSFTAFADSGTGIRGYEWGLGSEPNQTNVAAFRPFDGTVAVCGCPLFDSPSLWLACTHLPHHGNCSDPAVAYCCGTGFEHSSSFSQCMQANRSPQQHASQASTIHND